MEIKKGKYLITFIIISVILSSFTCVKAIENEVNNQDINSSVIVKYIDTDGNELLPPNIINGKIGDKYYIYFIPILNYRVHGNDLGNIVGTFSDVIEEIVYVYEKIPATILINYIEASTGNVLYETRIHGFLGEVVKPIYPKEFEGYELIIYPGDVAYYSYGEMTSTYYYIKKSDVVTKYVDINTNKEIATQECTNYRQYDKYTTNIKNISDYTYYSSTDNISGEVGREDIEVIYYYKKNTSVTIKYIDELTNEEISEKEIISGTEDKEFDTNPKEIDGYEYISYDGITNGKMSRNPSIVTYKYKKIQDETAENIEIKNEIEEKIENEIDENSILVNTGDISVILLSFVAIISILGISVIILKKKLFNV